MAKKIESTKKVPKSKAVQTKHKVKVNKKLNTAFDNAAQDNAVIVNCTPDVQAQILAIYHYLQTEVKDGSLDKTLTCFGKELTQLFGADVVGSAPSMKVTFEGGSDSKAVKKAVALKAAQELEEVAKAAAEAARKAVEEAAASDSDDDSSSSSSDSDSDEEPAAPEIQASKVDTPKISKRGDVDGSSSSSSSDSDDEPAASKIQERIVEAPKASKNDDDSSSSSSDSDTDSESDDEAEAPKKEKAIVKATENIETDSPSTSDESEDKEMKDTKKQAEVKKDDSDSSGDSSSDSDSDDDEEPPSKKAKTAAKEVKPVVKANKTVAKEENDSDVSDTDVSDVEVSDVSSVDTSSDEDSDSSSDSESDSDSDSSSDDSSSDEENADEIRARKAADAKKKAAAASAAAAAWVPTPPKNNVTVEIKTEKGSDGAQAMNKGTPFKRVDDQHWGEVAHKDGGAMADNSYEGAFGENGYGARASQKLMQVQGKRFQHEKTKAKRSYNGFAKTGQGITLTSNSSKFQYSDGE
jgi:hypothetical protein